MKTKPSLQMTQPILSTPGLAVTAVHAPVRPPRHLWRRMWRRGSLLAGGLLAAMMAAGLVWFQQSDYLLPGVSVLGVEVGGMTQAEATAVLSHYWQQQTIALEADGFGLLVPPDALGMQFDAEATAVLAHQFSHSPRRWLQWLDNRGHLPSPPVWEFNPALAAAGLQALSPELAVPAKNAELVWADGRLRQNPALAGQKLDVPATLSRLAQNPAQVFADGRLPLAVQPVFPAIADVSQAAAALNGLLETAVTLSAYDPISDETVTRVLEPAVWGEWLAWQLNPGGSLAGWSLDDGRLQAFLAADWGEGRFVDGAVAGTAVVQAIASRQPQINLRLYHPPQQHIVQPGETVASIGRAYGIPYPWIQQANPSSDDQLWVGQTLTIPSPDVMVPLPVARGKRIMVSLSQQRLWAYENGQLKWEWPVSSGIDSSPTWPGVFQVQNHEPNAYAANWDLWMPNFMGIYRPVPTSDFMNGFHGFPTRDGVNLLWTGNLGSQVTYGCIMLSNANMALLYAWAETGTIVVVQP